MAAADERLASAAAVVVGASERLLADRGRVAQVAVDLRKIHDAGRRLQRLLGGPAAPPGEAGAARARRHELNNALNQVLGYVELLLEEPGTAPLSAELERIRAAGREIRALVNAARAPVAGSPTPAPPTGSVLIVDDDPGNRELLTRYLAPHGHQVMAMEHGRWALQIATAGPVDVILLDLDMPRLDGYETLRLLKADPRLAAIAVIVVSATDELPAIVRCLELGAEDYLTKPVNPLLLNTRVMAGIVRKRQRDHEARDREDLDRLTAAAAAIEKGTLDPASLAPVTARADALGHLARVLLRLATDRPAG